MGNTRMNLSKLDLVAVSLFVASCGKLLNSSDGDQINFLMAAAVSYLVLLLLTLRSSSEFTEAVPHLAFITLNVMIAASKLKKEKESTNYLKTLACVLGACAVGLVLAPLGGNGSNTEEGVAVSTFTTEEEPQAQK